MVFHWSLDDNKSPQVSRTLLSILADLNNILVWMVSTCPLISNFSSLRINPLLTVPSTLITIDITVTFMLHRFLALKQSPGIYLSFCFFSVLLCGQPGRQCPLFGRFSFCWLLLGLVVRPRLIEPFLSQNPKEICAAFSWTDSRLYICNLFDWS